MIHYFLFYVLFVSIWFLYFFLYKNYMIDYTRQQLFKIRDDLFDYAANQEINFDDEAYLTTRIMLNGVIRFTHNISLTRWLIMLTVTGKENRAYEKQFFESFSSSLNKLNNEQQKIIKTSIVMMHYVIINHLLNTSPLLFIVFKPVLFLIRLLYKASKMKDVFAKRFNDCQLWKPIDAQANLIGQF